MKALGIYLKMDEISALIQRIDKDGSGVIEFEEFMTLMAEKIVSAIENILNLTLPNLFVYRVREIPRKNC